MPKCKQCKEKFEPKQFNQKYCLEKDECIKAFLDWVKEQKQKSWNKEKVQKKKELMTVQDYVKIAQAHFNTYIRKRDDGSVCISCQKPPKKKNAGHYFNSNNHWAVRFNEDNVHLQCEHCNTSLSGNLIPYRKYLIEKIGIERFEALESIAYNTRKFTIEELKEIINEYKQRIK